VNWEHFRAFLWLRWRLLINQLRRGGIVNAVALGILIVLIALGAGSLSIGLFFTGLFGMPAAPPLVRLVIWDGVAGVFLLFWMIGLMMELQRSEVLSLDRFLHLPVSLRGVFVINYLSSLICPDVAIFLPAMLALALGFTLRAGPALLVQFPLLAAFLLMVTGVTYQFQGWLASLMTNPRRRRTVIVTVMMACVLMFQVPSLINVFRPWEKLADTEASARDAARVQELGRKLAAGEINAQQYQQQLDEQRRADQIQAADASRQTMDRLESTTRLVNTILPPGWLALGVTEAAEGNVVPALLGTLGMGLIGAASLWRAYRTTLRLYTGQFTSGKRKPAVAAVPVAAHPAPVNASAGLLERQIPWIPERAAAVALCGFRSLLRAPEAKMMLLSPIILVLVFSGVFMANRIELPQMVRPLLVFGALTITLLTTSQILGNQFGFDRDGFRVLVLSAVPRRDILLGKNLAFAPFALGLTALAVTLVAVFQPLRLEHLLGALPQFVCMYLPFCLLANMLSMMAPMAIRPGSFKAANPKGTAILLHLAFAMFSPLALAPALIPLAVEFVVEELTGVGGLPICLLLSVLQCVAIVYLYRALLRWEGDVLQAREKKILEAVTTRAE
jgi:hypothetical protein